MKSGTLGPPLFCHPALREFLKQLRDAGDFLNNETLLDTFSKLDDNDVASIKPWTGTRTKYRARLRRQPV